MHFCAHHALTAADLNLSVEERGLEKLKRQDEMLAIEQEFADLKEKYAPCSAPPLLTFSRVLAFDTNP